MIAPDPAEDRTRTFNFRVCPILLIVLITLVLPHMTSGAGVNVGSFQAMNGKRFENASVTVEDLTMVKILHSSGITRIPLASMPDEVRAKLTDQLNALRTQADQAKAAVEKKAVDEKKQAEAAEQERVKKLMSVDISKVSGFDILERLQLDSKKRVTEARNLGGYQIVPSVGLAKEENFVSGTFAALGSKEISLGIEWVSAERSIAGRREMARKDGFTDQEIEQGIAMHEDFGSITLTVASPFLQQGWQDFFGVIVRSASGAMIERHFCDTIIPSFQQNGHWMISNFQLKTSMKPPFKVEVINQLGSENSIFDVLPIKKE